MLKILPVRFQQYMNHELPDVQAGFRKGRVQEPKIKLPASIGSSKKQESSRKTSTSALLTMPKPLTLWITANCGKFLEMGIPDCLTCLLRNLYAGQESTELDTEQQTGFKSGKEYIKAIYCHPPYLTSMQSTSSNMLGWMMHQLESRLPGKISIISDIQMTPPIWQ